MKKVYLTIDDGPSIGRREKVDVLFENNIQAIWFSVGESMLQRKEEVYYTIQKGGIIGNHSYSHPRFSDLSLEACYEEILKTDALIESLYNDLKIKRPMKVFRFPYGNKGVDKPFYNYDYTKEEALRVMAIQAFLRELGYGCPDFEQITYNYYKPLAALKHVDWYWTYDVMEWCIFQPKTLYGIKKLVDVLDLMALDLPERWMGLNEKQSEDIIVIHDHDETGALFEPIVKKLKAKGVVFAAYM